MKNEKGTMLIEVMVAMALLGIIGVALLSEPAAAGSPARLVAKALVSIDPENDPGLDGIEAIELRLALERSAPGEPLVPTPEFRLCTASGCPEFSPLDPHVPAPDPDAIVCGSRVAARPARRPGSREVLGILGTRPHREFRSFPDAHDRTRSGNRKRLRG